MIDLVFTDKSNNQTHFSKEIYGLTFSNEAQGGPTSLEVGLPLDLVAPKIKVGYDVALYDDLEIIWIGRVEERPKITMDNKTAVISCVGYMAALKDNLYFGVYQDSKLSNWQEVGANNRPAYTEQTAMEKFRLDKQNRLFITPTEDSYNTNDQNGFVYEIPENSTVRLKKVTASYATNYISNRFQLRGWWSTGGALNNFFTKAVNGSTSGTLSSTFGANATHIVFGLICMGTTILVPSSNAEKEGDWYGKLTNVKVYGTTDYTTPITASNSIKDILSKNTNLSTDYSQITTTTDDIEHLSFITQPETQENMIIEADKGERFNYGFWNRDSSTKPRFTYENHSTTKIDYFVTTRTAKPQLAGETLDNVVNTVYVGFKESGDNSRTEYVKRTASVPQLTDLSLTRATVIDINTESSNQAATAGDKFLVENARPQTKGQINLTNEVRDISGRLVPIHQLKAGTNLMIRDLEAAPQDLTTMTSTNVLNGKNIFRVTQVDVNYPESASLQLDSGADRLEDILQGI